VKTVWRAGAGSMVERIRGKGGGCWVRSEKKSGSNGQWRWLWERLAYMSGMRRVWRRMTRMRLAEWSRKLICIVLLALYIYCVMYYISTVKTGNKNAFVLLSLVESQLFWYAIRTSFVGWWSVDRPLRSVACHPAVSLSPSLSKMRTESETPTLA